MATKLTGCRATARGAELYLDFTGATAVVDVSRPSAEKAWQLAHGKWWFHGPAWALAADLQGDRLSAAPSIVVGEWCVRLTLDELAAVMAALGLPPIPDPAPVCPTHNGPMTPVGPGAWACDACVDALAVPA